MKHFNTIIYALYAISIILTGCEGMVRGNGSTDIEINDSSRALERINPTLSNQEGRRVALVIGNSAYNAMPNSLQPLANPVNDAIDITTALQKLGFQVTLKKDATLKQMDDTIYTFGQQLRRDDVALVYYSGHGMQVKGENYLIPVDAQFEREDQIDRQSVRANKMLEQIAEAKTKLVFLDACRNNPFSSRGMRGGSMGGLARMDTPSGTLLVYSTDRYILAN